MADEESYIDLKEVATGELVEKEGAFFSELDAEDNRKRQLLNDGIEQDNKQRLDYADKAHAFVQVWVGFLIVLISAQFGLKPYGVGLETEEFVVVVASLTASVFGFWSLVGRYLFPSKTTGEDS